MIDTQLLLPPKKILITKTETDMGRRKHPVKKPKREETKPTENKNFLYQKQIENRKEISI